MSEIPHEVLSEKFSSLMGGRKLRSAVFLAFEFDPGFFEQEILPALFDVSLSHVPEIRLLGLADELRKVDDIAVYYDRQALIAGAASSHLDIQRVAVSQRTGYFHPKVVLVLVEDALLVGILSANLTRSGWWENVEVAHIEEVRRDSPCSFRQDLLALIARVRRAAAHVARQPALDAIEKFVRSVPADDQRMRGGVVLPRLFFGDGDLVGFLREVAGNRLQRCNLEILSPFFDDKGSLEPIRLLRDAFRPRAVRVFLPRRVEGDALCSAEYYDRMREVADWGKLPHEVMRLSKDLDRALHAKVYRFFDPERRYEAFFVGSANLTTAALARGGNIESGFFVEVTPKRKPGWWMSVDESRPPAFMPRSEEEPLPQGRGWRLSVEYRWSDERASCFWDSTQPSPPLILLAHGVEIVHLLPLGGGETRECSEAESQAIATALRSGSFLTVRIEGEPDAQILVSEEQMTHKPSLMARVTAADILRYWSLLTPEQKKEFLEEHAEAFDDPEIAMWLGSARTPQDAESFFSTFAEVFLSFGNLDRAVRAALAEGRMREAVERLFGKKFDSLRRLIDRVAEEPESDAVRRYIILLSARQMLEKLEKDEPELFAAHRADARALRAGLRHVDDVRSGFAFGTPDERDQFFSWFDRWFIARAEPMLEANQ
jgi:hypothetical protein